MARMIRGRPREFDEATALQAAMEVFWKKGYEATSCDDLLSAMGINAGSMYAAFGDKQSLYEKALDLYCNNQFCQVTDMLENGPGTPLERIRGLFQMMAKHVAEPGCKGCFIGNTLLEFDEDSTGIIEMASNAMKLFQETIEKTLAAAKQDGELSKSAQPAALAAFLANTAQGLNVMSKAGTDKKTMQAIVQTALNSVKNS